jgi:hypothetical protein
MKLLGCTSVLSFLHEYVNLSIVGNIMFIIIIMNYHFEINKNTFKTCVPVQSYAYVTVCFCIVSLACLFIVQQEMFTKKFLCLTNWTYYTPNINYLYMNLKYSLYNVWCVLCCYWLTGYWCICLVLFCFALQQEKIRQWLMQGKPENIFLLHRELIQTDK